MAFLGKICCILNKGPALWLTFVEYVFIRNQNPKFNFGFNSIDLVQFKDIKNLLNIITVWFIFNIKEEVVNLLTMPILAKQISKFSNQFTNTWIAITSNSNDILNTFDNERRIFKWNTVSHCLQNIIYTSWALYWFIKEKKY